MKRNLPITNREEAFPSGNYIVSKTDKKGIVTYVNEVFEQISGFTAAEIVGRNHNIVRHPDMPEAAFEWLWATLKKGFPWEGIVKNRCKNGNFYWVKAAVSPIRNESGEVVGYLSVRTRASVQEIRGAESVYAKMNAGQRVKLDRSWIYGIPVRTKLYALLTGLIGVIVIGSSLDVMSQRQSLNRLDTAYQVHLNTAMGAGRLLDQLGEGHLHAEKVLQSISGENNPLAATSENDYQRWRAEFEAIRQRYPIPEGTPAIERSLMEAFSRAQNSLLSDGLDLVIKEANQGNQARAQEILTARIPVLFADVRKTANALQEHLSTIGADVMRDGQHQFQTMLSLSIGGALLAAFAVAIGGGWLVRTIDQQFKEMIGLARRISSGNLTQGVDITWRDEFGRTLCELAAMQTNLLVLVDEMKRVSSGLTLKTADIDTQLQCVIEESDTQLQTASRVASATDEFATAASSVASSAGQTAQAVQSNTKAIVAVERRMDLEISATNHVVSAVHETNAYLQQLSDSLGKINGITSAIKDIACPR